MPRHIRARVSPPTRDVQGLPASFPMLVHVFSHRKFRRYLDPEALNIFRIVSRIFDAISTASRAICLSTDLPG